MLESDEWLRPVDQGSARVLVAAIHEAGHAVAALEFGIGVEAVLVGPGTGPAEDSGGCVRLSVGWRSSQDALVVLMASRSAVLRWLVWSGLATGENLATVEESFRFDEIEIGRVIGAGRVDDPTRLRALADEIVGRRWADVARLTRQILDSGGQLSGEAMTAAGFRVNPEAAPQGVFAVAWPADVLEPGSEQEIQTALFAVAAAGRVAVAEDSGFEVSGVHVHAGPDRATHGMSIQRPAGTDRAYAVMLLAGRAAAAWWLVRTGQDSTRRLALLDNVEVVLADEITAAVKGAASDPASDGTGDGRSSRQLRADAALTVHRRWDRIVDLTQAICDSDGQLPVVPSTSTSEEGG